MVHTKLTRRLACALALCLAALAGRLAVNADPQPVVSPLGLPAGWVSAADFGADPTYTRDSAPALQKALDAGAPVVYLPAGRYWCLSQLVVSKPVRLVGAGTGGIYPQANLFFDQGVGGILVRAWSETPNQDSADCTRLENLGLKMVGSFRPPVVAAHGIESHVRVAVLHCRVDTFSGHGVYLHGSVPAGNVSLSEVSHCVIESCGGDGFYIHGNDGNAGNVKGVSSNNNLGNGFEDASLLGNNYWGCHTEGNQGSPYKIGLGGPSQAVLVGCYAEGGQGRSQFNTGVMVIGFDSGSDWTGGMFLSPNNSSLTLMNGQKGVAALTCRGWLGDPATPPFMVKDQRSDAVNFSVGRLGDFGNGGDPGPQYPCLWRPLVRDYGPDPLTGASAPEQTFALLTAAGPLGSANVAAFRGRLRKATQDDGEFEIASLQGGKYVPAARCYRGRLYAGAAGFVATPMTAAQQQALNPAPEEGTLTYNPDRKRMQFWDGSSWQTLAVEAGP